jgi:hypothetical protein
MGDHTRVDAAGYLSRRRFIGRCASAAAGLAVAGCLAGREPHGDPGPRLVTTLGDLALPDTGVILPHEHIFLAGPRQEGVQVEDVIEVMQPELEAARAAGVAVLVDAGSPSLGRRADIIVAVSRAARLPVVVPTGFYLDPSMPEWARVASEEELRDWMIGELVGGMDGKDVKAGWIKLAASDGDSLNKSASACVPLPARAQRPTQPSAATSRAAAWPATRWIPWKGRATEPSASSGYTPTMNPCSAPAVNATGDCARNWHAEVHGWSSTRSGSPSMGVTQRLST